MAAISARDLDEDVTARLKVRAAQHARSMEAEVQMTITSAVLEAENQGPNLAQAIRQRVTAADGAEVQMPTRQDMPRAADLSTLP